MSNLTQVKLATRRNCPNVHAHLKELCLTDAQRRSLEYPENFVDGVVGLPNRCRFPPERIPSANERICDRCNSQVRIEPNGECLPGLCTYHDGRPRGTCCGGRARGCKTAVQHVHIGNLLTDSTGFIKFSPRPENVKARALAIDTEMIYTTHGMDVAQINVVDVSGSPVYERIIRPKNGIVDYNTQFSGITERTFIDSDPVSLDDVHRDLKDIIFEDTVLVGHGLKSDFRGLKIYHANVVDTSFYYKNSRGWPQKLKNLSETYLRRSIQSGIGHDSNEDAVAAMDLALLLIKKCDCSELP